MKILWLDLNSSYAHASLALPALHAQVMHDPSLEWGVVSATINENPGMTAGEVVRQAPDILAATCWLFNHEVLMHVISRVKAMLPRCVVALGGPEFLGHNEDFLRTNRFVDCVFRGEGEETFPQWLACWQQPKEWTRITGLCFLDTEGQYHDNGLSRVMAFDKLVNPEQSPFFNWSKAVRATGNYPRLFQHLRILCERRRKASPYAFRRGYPRTCPIDSRERHP